MEIIIISGVKLLPPKIEYREYRGNLADCQREHAAQYPHYQPNMAYWIEARKSLFVPMEWRRDGNGKAA